MIDIRKEHGSIDTDNVNIKDKPTNSSISYSKVKDEQH